MGRAHSATPPVSQTRLVDHRHAAEALLAVAGEVDADLLMIGTRGFSDYRLLRLGGVTMQLLHHSDRPVIVVTARVGRRVMTAVEANDLRVIRGGSEILRGLAFTVAAGTVTGLIGPSGSGKTTLMRAIVGVQRNVPAPCTSSATRRQPSTAPRVAYLTQAPSIYADLTVRENLRYFAAYPIQPRRPSTRRSTLSG